jgi:hypothetical protein
MIGKPQHCPLPLTRPAGHVVAYLASTLSDPFQVLVSSSRSGAAKPAPRRT